MERLNDILHELGISKVKLAKFLGVSRQMIYNYLELDDLGKWPKDKKVLLLNLLGIKSPEELENLKVNTDYIIAVENRLNSICDTGNKTITIDSNSLLSGLGKKEKELMINLIDIIKERLEDNDNPENYYIFKYLYHFLQSLDNSKELKYLLGYFAKTTGFIKPLEFAFDEDEQFIFESIMFSAMTLYHSGGASKSKIAESHRRFVAQIDQKREEKLSRTMELNTIKVQALKELGYTEITERNAAEVFAKIAEIEARGGNR